MQIHLESKWISAVEWKRKEESGFIAQVERPPRLFDPWLIAVDIC